MSLNPGRGAVPPQTGRTIWRFALSRPSSIVVVPMDAEVVHVGEQNQMVCIWVRCSRDAPTHHRRYVAINTGDDVPADTDYVGTAITKTGVVWHVFEDLV